MGQEVVAHLYDVAVSGSEGANATVLHINRFFKDAIGLGGIFHIAIQIYGDEEWSFGYCEHGTGVFSCPPCKNPMYTFRESIVLGKTSCSIFTVNQILQELSWEWSGGSYELLSRNCNHFCNAFCDKLDVPKLPGWVNRFANAGDAALEVAETTAAKLKQAKKEIMSACKATSTYLTGSAVKYTIKRGGYEWLNKQLYFSGDMDQKYHRHQYEAIKESYLPRWFR